MRLLSGLTFLSKLAAGRKTCDTAELYLPDNAVEWQCEDSKNNRVQTGNDCKLVCQAGYSEAICKFFW